MADPISAAVMVGVGTMVSAMGSIQQGNAANQAANYNAQMAERQATLQQQIAAADAEEIARQNRLAQGHLRATAGASGLIVGDGSSLDVQLDNAETGELNRLKRLWQGDVAAYNARNQAQLDYYAGAQAQRAGLFNAGSKLLTGIAKGASLVGGDLFGGDGMASGGTLRGLDRQAAGQISQGGIW